MTKICLNCGKEFPKPHCSNKQWAKRKFCSPKCSKQGQKYLNRGHKTLICIKSNIRKPRRHNRICDHCWHLDRMKRWKNGELLHHPKLDMSIFKGKVTIKNLGRVLMNPITLERLAQEHK